MLNAESYPSWFDVTYHGNRMGMQLLFPRGFSANLVLLIWSVLGSVLAYGFLSMYRAMLLNPVLETPVDTAEDILSRNMTPFVHPMGQIHIDILKQSNNQDYQKLDEKYFRNLSKYHDEQGDVAWDYSEEDFMKILAEDVQGAGTHVYLGTDLSPQHEKFGEYHWSKEEVRGASPYNSWVVNKRWTLNEELAVHLLRFQQVCINNLE